MKENKFLAKYCLTLTPKLTSGVIKRIEIASLFPGNFFKHGK